MLFHNYSTQKTATTSLFGSGGLFFWLGDNQEHIFCINMYLFTQPHPENQNTAKA